MFTDIKFADGIELLKNKFEKIKTALLTPRTETFYEGYSILGTTDLKGNLISGVNKIQAKNNMDRKITDTVTVPMNVNIDSLEEASIRLNERTNEYLETIRKKTNPQKDGCT